MKLPRDQASSLRAPQALGVQVSAKRVDWALDQSGDSRTGDVDCSGPTTHAQRPTPLLAIASGKGGVGKTFLAVNLALALRAMGRRPLLVDLDWGLANVDVALGLAPERHIGHVLAGDCSLEGAMIEHEGITILPNGCGQSELARLDAGRRSALVEELGTGRSARDFLIVDTHPGIGALTVDVAQEATATLVVSTPEPTALTDTYALFKVLGEGPMQGPAGLIINQAGSPDRAYEAARHLDSVSRRFLGRGIVCWGYVLQDTAVPRSVQQQRALMTTAPRSEAARLVRLIAGTVAALLEPAGGGALGEGLSMSSRRIAGVGGAR